MCVFYLCVSGKAYVVSDSLNVMKLCVCISVACVLCVVFVCVCEREHMTPDSLDWMELCVCECSVRVCVVCVCVCVCVCAHMAANTLDRWTLDCHVYE